MGGKGALAPQDAAFLRLELVLGQCARITQPGKGLQLLDPDAVFVGSERLFLAGEGLLLGFDSNETKTALLHL